MKLSDTNRKMSHHLKKAIELLPPVIVPFPPRFDRERLDEEARKNEWQQVWAILHGWKSRNNFSQSLLAELQLVDEYMRHHHRQVMEYVIERTPFTDRKVIEECLQAIAEGPFIPDCEFPSLFGLERERFQNSVAQWPNQESLGCADPAMNNLLGYPHRKESEWSNYISASPEEVRLVHKRWLTLIKEAEE